MNNKETLETLIYNTAVRNSYVLKIKKYMENTYGTINIPLRAIIIYMEEFIKKLGGNEYVIEIVVKSIMDWFNDDVTLKHILSSSDHDEMCDSLIEERRI